MAESRAGSPPARSPHALASAAARLETGHAYERALFGGRMDELGEYLTDDVTYWVAGAPPIGGLWRGREAVVGAFANREFGLGAADWGYEELRRDWSAPGDDRVVVEIHEKSWLKSDPSDVIDQRTYCVLRFRDGRIAAIEDYTDAHLYEEFAARHRADLPRFRGS